jgi:NAD+ synthase (glutamine-hydrolysing)
MDECQDNMLPICTAQLNYRVGDVKGNAQRIVQAARDAHAQGARMLVTPELALCGYAAEDLFLRPGFIADCEAQVQSIALALADLSDFWLFLGHPQSANDAHGRVHNRVSVLQAGQVLAHYNKRVLPNDSVFDEQRYFVAGDAPLVLNVHGLRVGVLICEDAWHAAPALDCQQAGAQLLLVLNASPFHLGKQTQREAVMRERVSQTGLPLLYAHWVGGQDEFIFDGASFALNADGGLVARAAFFKEDAPIWNFAQAHGVQSAQAGAFMTGAIAVQREALADLWDALVLGVRDYVGKNGFPSVLLGLSGGIDSALVLALAVDALGPERVRTVMMPSPYTASISLEDAKDMAERLAVRHDEMSIEGLFAQFRAVLEPLMRGLPEDTTEENIQARIRGTLLMALSNKTGALVLTTGNKSEMATGYCTLYGDMAGGFAVIKDVLKTQVFALARWRNANNPYGTCPEPIPERIITRPPSAELRPDQTDQDSLPSYEMLDAIIERYMEQNQNPAEMVAAGCDAQAVAQVVRLMRLNEYKRRQAPVGIRVTPRSFGKDWRYPITQSYRP